MASLVNTSEEILKNKFNCLIFLKKDRIWNGRLIDVVNLKLYKKGFEKYFPDRRFYQVIKDDGFISLWKLASGEENLLAKMDLKYREVTIINPDPTVKNNLEKIADKVLQAICDDLQIHNNPFSSPPNSPPRKPAKPSSPLSFNFLKKARSLSLHQTTPSNTPRTHAHSVDESSLSQSSGPLKPVPIPEIPPKPNPVLPPPKPPRSHQSPRPHAKSWPSENPPTIHERAARRGKERLERRGKERFECLKRAEPCRPKHEDDQSLS